jgi:hypothetical protein
VPRPRRVVRARWGYLFSVRTLFFSYLALIVGGLAYFIAVGVLNA